MSENGPANRDAALLLKALFPPGTTGFVETRCPREGVVKRQDFARIGEQHRVYGVGSPPAKWDVFVGAAPRSREDGTKAAVDRVWAAWADLDRADAANALADFEPPPAIVVATGSPGHLHAYWPLNEPVGPGEIERINRDLAERLGGDPASCDASRVMRLPGSLNCKHDPPVRAAVVEASERRFDLAELEAALDLDAGADRPEGASARDDLDTSEPVAGVLNRLEGVKKTAAGWQALCPAHDDAHASLSIKEGDDGRCLLYCHAGCATESIVEQIGMTMADLFAGSSAKRAASRLIQLAEQQGLELLHAGETPYASMRVGGHLRTWPIKSEGLERELRRIQYKASGEGLGEFVLREATATFGAKAIFDGPEKPVYHRVAGLGERIVIDLGDATGQAIEISAEGWRLVDDPGIHFIREPSDLPFPVPVAGSSIEELRDFTNCANESSFKLLVGATIMCLHPTGPYPVIYITGEQGSAKSTHSRLVASLADPRRAPLSMGRPSAKDLVVIANGVRLAGFDNVSYIPAEFSNWLCQLATGAGYRDRTLYSNADQTILEAKLAVQLNGIGNVIKRPDLQERVALIELRPIPPEKRRTEDEFWPSWEEAAPRIFGAIVDGVCSALANCHSVELPGYPRMADFARWGEAAGIAFGWEPGAFVAALEGGQSQLLEGGVEAHPELEALLRLIDEEGSWEGTATDLLALLASKVSENVRKGSAWPKKADALSKRLDEHTPLLRAHGIEFVRVRKGGGGRTRLLRIAQIGDAGTRGDA